MGQVSVAFVFPGQGSQVVGMGKELAGQFPEARSAFEEADHALGGGLSRLCWEGPEGELQKTANTQPAIVTASTACLRVLAACGGSASFVAGHSVGEYSALVAAGAIPLAAAARLTRLRGELMEAACPQGTGTMAAIVGLDEEAVVKVCAEVSRETGMVSDIAGLNCPGQVVVAGHVEALTMVVEKAKSWGAGSATILKVSGPFHSALMAPAQAKLAEELGRLPFAGPRVPVVTNVDAQPHSEAAELREQLVGQLTKPVLWHKSVQNMIAAGVGLFIELGAGRVLSGLIRRISRDVQVVSVSDAASLEKALGMLSNSSDK